MRCAWQAFLNLLPVWMRQRVDKQGRNTLQELRLRLNLPPEMITSNGSQWIEQEITPEDLRFAVNMASKYSPWAASTSAQGYITAPGGHRLGLCGDTVAVNGSISGFHTVTSICIRVARDFPDIAKNAEKLPGSILIIGSPGSGKTTLLRDLIRKKSDYIQKSIAVVDEREEIFPRTKERFCFPIGSHTDVLSGCRKSEGIEAVLRCMGPNTIAVDEITAAEDCQALLHAGWCGVKLMATAHAGSKQELFQRPVYKPILESGLFDTLLILQPDKSWRSERMT